MDIILHMCPQPDVDIDLKGGIDMSTASHCQMVKPESCFSRTAVGWMRGQDLVPGVLMECLIKSVHEGWVLRCWGGPLTPFSLRSLLDSSEQLMGL